MNLKNQSKQLTPEELEKVLRLRGITPVLVPIDEYQMFIAEYGLYFGYVGMQAILNDDISLEDIMWQVLAARKVRSGMTYDMAKAVYAGAVASTTENQPSTFKELTKEMITNSKADA